MAAVEQRVQEALQSAGGGASSWESLITLFDADREAFYLLACDGVGDEAPPWLAELADHARRVREAVRGTCQIEHSDGGSFLAGPGVERTFVPGPLVERVATFLLAVDGKGTADRAGKDYEGVAVSEAEARFQLGERATWEAERGALQARMDATPLVLRLDQDDLDHLAIQPGYVTFGLTECARRVVLAPTQVFRELKRGDGCQDNLREAMAFCGKPRRAVDNAGRVVDAPEGMVFVVYADAEGYVFDWDWVQENHQEAGCPVDRADRFGEPIELGRDAVLELPDQLPEPDFDWTKACYSPRGDCIFCYIADDVACACRINADLTVFRSLADRRKITGFKVKNVRRILEEDREIVLASDPDLVVSVQSALLATLKGHRDAPVCVYEVFIEAFRRVAAPPRVRVPKRRLAARRATACV